jgi:choloylglycine hydrolase
MEFAIDPHSDIMISPRGFERVGTTPDGKPGKAWKAKYASVGANGLGLKVLVDGFNEKGLAAELFYFPGTAGYMPYSPADAGNTMAPWELGSWLLDNFASVDEVKANIGKVVVPAVLLKAWNLELEVHFVVHDVTGKSMVIEYTKGKLDTYDNPLGVFTNSPAFDWQMTNLRNYLNFSMSNAPPLMLDKSVTLTAFGQGSGMLGMPGDFTPPSRFVRAVAFSHSVLPSASGKDAVLQAFHVLNQFDIPKGAAREHEKDEHGNVLADYTIWTAASDLKARKYYFRTYENSQIRSVDLMMMNLDAKDVVLISMKGNEVVKSLGS